MTEEQEKRFIAEMELFKETQQKYTHRGIYRERTSTNIPLGPPLGEWLTEIMKKYNLTSEEFGQELRRLHL